MHEYLEMVLLYIYVSSVCRNRSRSRTLYDVRNNGLGDKDVFSYRSNTFLLATAGPNVYCFQTSLLSRGHRGILYPGVKRSQRQSDRIYTSNIQLSLNSPIAKPDCGRLIAGIVGSNPVEGSLSQCTQRDEKLTYHSTKLEDILLFQNVCMQNMLMAVLC